MSKAFKRRFKGGAWRFGHFDVGYSDDGPPFTLKRKRMDNVFVLLSRYGMGRPIYFNHNLPVQQRKVRNKVVPKERVLRSVPLTQLLDFVLKHSL